MRKALVTGATGFVGSALCRTLHERGIGVRAALRNDAAIRFAETCVVGDFAATPDWTPAVAGVDTVFHLAARVHQLHESAADAEALYRRVNCAATLNLAHAAASAGCRRFVFVSSVKVNGEATADRPFRDDDPPAPTDAYGRSKRDAEAGLAEIARTTGLEVVVVRPPLVYGPGVGANFRRLVRLVERRLPLPFAAVANRRSLVDVGNLVDALVVCATHPAAAGRTYLVSDDDDVSTAELSRRIAAALGVEARLWPFPPALLRLAGRLFGRAGEVQRLTGSLQVDVGPLRRELGWTPPRTMAAGLRETVAAMHGESR